jgi:GMP synthase-like glutamine amidotransferase
MVCDGDLPGLANTDLLVVMGGPMNIYQEAEYPWLIREKALLKTALDQGTAILGICLGAQLLADALGGTVAPNDDVEIGWFPVDITAEARHLHVLADLPPRFTALHWHGDTFTIPRDAIHCATSAACQNQAFAYDDGRVLGLQFHLEETPASLQLLIEHARAELRPGKWVQTESELLDPRAPFNDTKSYLFHLLDRMAEKVGAERT